MKVKCIKDFWAVHRDRSYTVYGVICSKYKVDINSVEEMFSYLNQNTVEEDVVDYLIADVENSPEFYDAAFFEVVDERMPEFWQTAVEEIEVDKEIFRVGFEEMVESHQFYVDIKERKKSALQIFQKRKKEIDDYYTAKLALPLKRIEEEYYQKEEKSEELRDSYIQEYLKLLRKEQNISAIKEATSYNFFGDFPLEVRKETHQKLIELGDNSEEVKKELEEVEFILKKLSEKEEK
jgi:hypothetical protein